MDKLGLRELLRYAYVGFLCVFVAVVANGTWTARMIERLGDVLAPLVAITVGAVIYLVFRALIGDPILWRVNVCCHRTAEGLFRQKTTRCKVRCLESDEYGVDKGQGLKAYALIRNQLFPRGVGELLHVQNSETYLLFLTAFVCGIASVLGFLGQLRDVQRGSAWLFALVALVTFAAGVCRDTFTCQSECSSLRLLDHDEVRKTLIAARFIEEP